MKKIYFLVILCLGILLSFILIRNESREDLSSIYDEKNNNTLIASLVEENGKLIYNARIWGRNKDLVVPKVINGYPVRLIEIEPIGVENIYIEQGVILEEVLFNNGTSNGGESYNIYYGGSLDEIALTMKPYIPEIDNPTRHETANCTLYTKDENNNYVVEVEYEFPEEVTSIDSTLFNFFLQFRTLKIHKKAAEIVSDIYVPEIILDKDVDSKFLKNNKYDVLAQINRSDVSNYKKIGDYEILDFVNYIQIIGYTGNEDKITLPVFLENVEHYIAFNRFQYSNITHITFPKEYSKELFKCDGMVKFLSFKVEFELNEFQYYIDESLVEEFITMNDDYINVSKCNPTIVTHNGESKFVVDENGYIFYIGDEILLIDHIAWQKYDIYELPESYNGKPYKIMSSHLGYSPRRVKLIIPDVEDIDYLTSNLVIRYSATYCFLSSEEKVCKTSFYDKLVKNTCFIEFITE